MHESQLWKLITYQRYKNWIHKYGKYGLIYLMLS